MRNRKTKRAQIQLNLNGGGLQISVLFRHILEIKHVCSCLLHSSLRLFKIEKKPIRQSTFCILKTLRSTLKRSLCRNYYKILNFYSTKVNINKADRFLYNRTKKNDLMRHSYMKLQIQLFPDAPLWF